MYQNLRMNVKIMEILFLCEIHDEYQCKLLIHSADPQSRSVGIIVFAHVRPSVRPLFSKSSKTKQSENNVFPGETVGLAEWIIDDTCLVETIFGKND